MVVYNLANSGPFIQVPVKSVTFEMFAEGIITLKYPVYHTVTNIIPENVRIISEKSKPMFGHL
jgi:hypothetical protein